MPLLTVIGGPNGAGKTTSALELLPRFMACYEYVNADAIAAGLSPFRPAGVALQAGRLMLARIHELAAQQVDFAFESTLASRTFVPFLQQCHESGYHIHLLYLWLPSPELAIERVAQRVRSGGHDIPEPTIRRRYEAGSRNFVERYMPLSDKREVFDNSAATPKFIATGRHAHADKIYLPRLWQEVVG